jgi:glucosamine--fructose-6-phosphate aminotransferase (isomerizing)
MCGIIAYLGSDDYKQYILSGLKLLQNRGYDSVGISYITKNNTLQTIKYASTNTNNSLELLENKMKTFDLQKLEFEEKCTIGIGHTRWATHGGKTDINAHPHHDNSNRISLVHNGIIENFQELKTQLIEWGYTFKSKTDTEIIAVMIGKYLDDGFSIELSIQQTITKLYGTWALVIIHCDYPNKMWVTRNGSPLLIGFEDDFVIIASEQTAFNNYIKKYIIIDNHDLIEIYKEDNIIKYNKDIQNYKINNKINTINELTPQEYGYPYWMIKEIYEQPQSIERAFNNGGRFENDFTVKLGGLDSYKSQLIELDHIIILGCGTSYHSGLWGSDIFKTLEIFQTVSVYDGAEFRYKDIPKSGKTGLILISQSGETKDLHRCIEIAKEYDLITIGIVNVVDSMIARETNCGVYLNAGREVAVASTKSFTNQCIVLIMIGIWFSQNANTNIEKRKKIIKDLRNLSYQLEIEISKHTCHIKELVEKWKTKNSIFLLGKGSNEAIVKEGALKLKEIAYIHAEGYSASSLKHGSYALIENGLPIILLDIDDIYRDKIESVYQELILREAQVIRISDKNENSDFYIQHNSTFGGIISNSLIQLISYYLAIAKGNNPDFPRNLAKIVTVD